MSVSKSHSVALQGVHGHAVEVEVNLSPGLFSYTTVGLPDAAVRESQERILASLTNAGFDLPVKRITVNLAPADIKKEGSLFDLAIAIAILKAEEIVTADLDSTLFIGELSLDGRVKKVRGGLCAAILAKSMGIKQVIVPTANGEEAAVVEGVDIICVDSLPQTIAYLDGAEKIEPLRVRIEDLFEKAHQSDLDFCDVKGQENVKRALEVACAGGHNILMIGPPGSGKSMMAKRIPSILPDFTFKEAIETTSVHSVSGHLPEGGGIVAGRPFRSPHHTISDAGLIGGGTNPVPGEVSIAHNGVLFLDEMPEFRRNVLEAMRQPLEDGHVTVSRASMSVTFPSRFMLAGAMNPCPCGFFSSPDRECSCNINSVRKYRNRISGPLMDRIDIHVEAPAVKYDELAKEDRLAESSLEIKKRVDKARTIQHKRYAGTTIFCNSQIGPKQIRKYARLDDASKNMLKNAVTKLGLSARAHEKIVKVARTIADLDGKESIGVAHVAEAVHYRTLDREIF